MLDHDETPKSDDSDYPDRIDADVPEADALEQSRSWGDGKRPDKPRIPDDVNAADALEQSQDVSGSDADDDRR